MEAEYVAPCDCVKGSVWLRRVLRFMNAEQGEPTAIFEDNNSCIALANNPEQREKAKHIDLKYHDTRSMVRDQVVLFLRCSTADQVADTFTKAQLFSSSDVVQEFFRGEILRPARKQRTGRVSRKVLADLPKWGCGAPENNSRRKD